MGSSVQYQLRDSATEFSARRRNRLLGRLRNVCPHIIDLQPADVADGKPALYYQLAFETHFGTFDYFCMRCRLQVSEYGVQVIQRQLERAFECDPVGTLKGLFESQGKATKLIEKINRLGGVP